MSDILKPILAGTVHEADFDRLEWPMLASPKIDGIRCIVHPLLGPVTRSFKPVANAHIRLTLANVVSRMSLDGELVGIDANGKLEDFNTTQSKVMTHGGQPTFVYRVFDCFVTAGEPFEMRYCDMLEAVKSIGSPLVEPIYHELVHSDEAFREYASACTEAGYEGAMLRHLQGHYKEGRSTLRQQYLLKYKEWIDAEGIVVGFEERMHNANEDIKDNFGHAKRSSHKENMVPMGTLGALILDTAWGELRVGSGLDDAQRQDIWDRNIVKVLKDGETSIDEYELVVEGVQPDMGRKVTFKYQAFGMKDKPRFPIFRHFREDE